MHVFQHTGFCPICEHQTTFTAQFEWFRDHLRCSDCHSIPRERALFKTITDYFPNYRDLDIHETSPSACGASIKLHQECKSYSASQFFINTPLGSIHQNGYRCEDIENLTFSDNSFDLFVSQDVMEHILDPEKAFKEIARVLKPGGLHIFTAPLIKKTQASERRASRSSDGTIIHHHEAEYHGNPIDEKGSLVAMHWGYDIASFIMDVAKTPTIIVQIDNINNGIRAEYIDVLVSCKPKKILQNKSGAIISVNGNSRIIFDVSVRFFYTVCLIFTVKQSKGDK